MAADQPLEAFVEATLQGSDPELDRFVGTLLAEYGVVQADWDPREHPRGPNGQFIGDPISAALDAIPLDSEAWVSKDSTDIEEGDVMKIVKNPFGGGSGKEEKVARVVDNAIIETYVEDADGERIEVGGVMSDWENHGIYDPDVAREERIRELEREEPPKVDPEDLDDLPRISERNGWKGFDFEDEGWRQVNPGDAVNVLRDDDQVELAEQRATVQEATSDRVAVTTAGGDDLEKDPDELEGDFDIIHHYNPEEEPTQSVDEGELTPEQRQAVREELAELPDIGRPDESADPNTPGDPGYFTSELAQDANDEQATSLAATLNEQEFLGIGYDAEPLDSEADLPEGFKQESELGVFDGPGTPTMDVLMDPEDFLHVSAQMRNEQNGIDQDLWKADVEENRMESLTDVLEGGADPDRGGIPMPVLQVNDTGDLMAFQEGRHRAWAALEAGYDRIPVRIGLDERGDGVQGAEAFVEASLADAGLLAFDPDAHPRGPDGKFIEALGLAAAFDAADDYFQRDRVFEAQDEMMAHGLQDDLNDFTEDFLVEQARDPESPIEDRDAALDAVLGKPDPEDGLGLEQIQEEWKDNQYSSPAVKPMWEAAAEALDRDPEEVLPDDSWFDGDVNTVESASDLDFADNVDEAMKAAFAFSQRYAEEHLADEDGKITVKRGIRGDLAAEAVEAAENGESLEVDPKALESWTLEENAAKYWADIGDEGAIITREIDVNDVALYAPAMIPEIHHQEEITTFGHEQYEIEPDQIEEFGGF